MNGHDILATLRDHESALRARGIRHVALFGSRARGDNRPDSDTDIMIELDPELELDVYSYVNLKTYVADLLDGQVDVVNRNHLKKRVEDTVAADATYAF